MTVSSVVGFQRTTKFPAWRVTHLGFVAEPARTGGYFLAMATGFGMFVPECVGGAATVELAAEIVRAKAGYPAFLPGRFDGDITRV